MATFIALTGILSGTGYMVCSGMNYFIQPGMVTGNMVLLSAIPYLTGIILLWIEFRRLREFD